MGRTKARKLHQPAAPADLNQLRTQVSDAMARGLFQTARQLAKDLFKQDPTEGPRRLLVEATLGRVAQLRAAGQPSEAGPMLRSALEYGIDSQDLLARCVRESALLGDWKAAQQLMPRISDAAWRSQIQAACADAAVLQGEQRLATLPTESRLGAEVVLRALAAVARGDDVAARELLIAVPDQPAWTDWKLLLDGFIDYYRGESPVQAWRQLDDSRAPAAMVAPFRARTEPDFLAAQPRDRQPELLAAASRLMGESWITALAAVRDVLATDNLTLALNKAADAARSIAPDRTDLRDRLARVMYWAVALRGDEHDVERYRRMFATPADDPTLARLQALQYEDMEGLEGESQDSWAQYERTLSDLDGLRDADRNLARSLVWFHMGILAEYGGHHGWDQSLPGPEDDEDFAHSAIECYRRSVELAPKHLKAHECLIDLLHHGRRLKEVAECARQLLAHFPEHERALEALADDAYRHGRWHDAVEFQERAVRARPHDKRVVEHLSFYRLGLARQHAQHDRFDEARTILNAELARVQPNERYSVLCRLAAVEFKAGAVQRADELYEQACQTAPSRLPPAFQMLIESVRLPLKRAVLKRFDREFRDGLNGPPHPASGLALLQTVVAHDRSGTTYDGFERHQKLVLKYLRRLEKSPFSEVELLQFCQGLGAFPTDKLLLRIAERGWREFRDEPRFPFAAAVYHISRGPKKCPVQKVRRALMAAQRRATGNPEHADLAAEIEQLLRKIRAVIIAKRFAGPIGRFNPGAMPPPDIMRQLAEMAGLPFGVPFGDDDFDDEFEYDSPEPRHRSRKPGESRDPNQGKLW